MHLDLGDWRADITGALIGALIAHVMSVALYSWLLKRRNLGGERVAGATLLRYPRGWHLFAWSMLVLPLAGLGWLAWKFPPKPDDVIYFGGLVVGFGLMGAYFTLQVSGVAHELRPDGLLRVTPWGPRCFLPWSEVTVLRYSALMTAWRIRTANGDAAWVWLALSGIGAFARAAVDHLPAEVIDRHAGTRLTLAEQTAGAREQAI